MPLARGLGRSQEIGEAKQDVLSLQASLPTKHSCAYSRFSTGSHTMQGWQGDLPQALLRLFESLQGLQDDLLPLVIVAAAFLAGLCGERLRAKLARQAWQKRRRRTDGGVPYNTGAPVTDPAGQLRLVMDARFEKRRLLSRSEAHVLYAAERIINTADLKWRVMSQ